MIPRWEAMQAMIPGERKAQSGYSILVSENIREFPKGKIEIHNLPICSS